MLKSLSLSPWGCQDSVVLYFVIKSFAALSFSFAVIEKQVMTINDAKQMTINDCLNLSANLFPLQVVLI